MATVNIRIDDELKQRADEAMKAAGTTPTSAITLLYQYIVEHGKLPFTAKTSLSTPDDTTLAIIRELQELHHYCWMVFDARPETRKSQGMATTMYIAGRITSIQSMLRSAQHSLSVTETSQLRLLLDSLFNLTPELLKTAPGDEEVQNILDSASQVIFSIERSHTILP